MKAVYFFLFLFLFSCNKEQETVTIEPSIFKWFEEAREHSINLVYDVSFIEEKKTKYIGTVMAAHPFINDSHCFIDSIPKYSFLKQYLQEEDFSFLEAQINLKPYTWTQEEFQYKKIVGKNILKLHNEKSRYEKRELDTTLWYNIKSEYNSEDINIVYRPIFTKDFKYAIITIDHYSFFQGLSWFNGCITLFCENKDGYWVIIDDLRSAVV